MEKQRIKRLIIVLVIVLFIVIAIATINNENERLKDSAMSDILDVFMEFDSTAYFQPLTYAGRSEWVPIAHDYNWDLIKLTSDEVLIYYCKSTSEANRLYEEYSLSDDSCWVLGVFIVYYIGSDDRVANFIFQTLSIT